MGANGTLLDVVGQTTATVCLRDFKVDHQLTVVRNLTVDCLLGANFLQHHGAVLHCCHKNHHPNGPQVQDPESSYAPTCTSCSPCNKKIPRRTVMLFQPPAMPLR